MAEKELQEAVVLFAQALLLAGQHKTSEAAALFRRCLEIRQKCPGGHLSTTVASSNSNSTQSPSTRVYVSTFNFGLRKSKSHPIWSDRRFNECIDRNQSLDLMLSPPPGPITFTVTGDLTVVQKTASSITLRSNVWSGRGTIVIHTASGDITGEIIIGRG